MQYQFYHLSGQHSLPTAGPRLRCMSSPFKFFVTALLAKLCQSTSPLLAIDKFYLR